MREHVGQLRVWNWVSAVARTPWSAVRLPAKRDARGVSNCAELDGRQTLLDSTVAAQGVAIQRGTGVSLSR